MGPEPSRGAPHGKGAVTVGARIARRADPTLVQATLILAGASKNDGVTNEGAPSLASDVATMTVHGLTVLTRQVRIEAARIPWNGEDQSRNEGDSDGHEDD